MKMGKSTREAFGLALAKLGEENSDVVVVDGDVHNSTRTDFFAKKFPERFFNVGIAESDLVGIAAGLACCGKRSWLSSFACFIMCNAYDQLRMSVAFPQLDVKVVGTPEEQFRLALSVQAQRVIAQSLDILGVSAPEEM